jgi:capsular polysaccharide biosynthesis protein
VSDAATTALGRHRRWPLLVVLVVTGAIVGLLVAAGTRPMYTASATSYIAVRSTASVGDLQQGGSVALRAGRSFAALATNRRVLDGVIEDLHLATTADALAQRIVAATAQDTVLLTVDVTDPSPTQAARIANAVQDRLGRTVAALAPAVRQGTGLTLIRPAAPPGVPSSPNAPLDAAIGALAGAAVRLLLVLTVAVRRRRPGPTGGLAAPSMF